MYTYKATVLRVVDGDTVDFKVDLGFYTTMALRFRLLWIDTPERGQSGWKEATEHLKSLLANKEVTIQTMKADGFGRWLCDVYLEDGSHVNQIMVDDGHAKPYYRRQL